MGATRLTKFMRSKVLERLVDHAFKDRRKGIVAMRYDLGDLVYADLYPTKDRAAMAKLPAGFLPEQDAVQVTFGGQWYNICFRKVVRVAVSHSSGRSRDYPSDHMFADMQSEISKHTSDLRADEELARAEAKAALNSCSTVKQLLELWPEVEPFVSDFVVTPAKTKALALSIPDLNAHLGL